MVVHIVAWNFKEDISEELRQTYRVKIKTELEALKDTIQGIEKIQVITEPLPTTTFDLVLVSEFESEAALDAYQIHPKHQEVAGFIRSVVTGRKCIDYTL